jgi:hypothetical protein
MGLCWQQRGAALLENKGEPTCKNAPRDGAIDLREQRGKPFLAFSDNLDGLWLGRPRRLRNIVGLLLRSSSRGRRERNGQHDAILTIK